MQNFRWERAKVTVEKGRVAPRRNPNFLLSHLALTQKLENQIIQFKNILSFCPSYELLSYLCDFFGIRHNSLAKYAFEMLTIVCQPVRQFLKLFVNTFAFT